MHSEMSLLSTHLQHTITLSIIINYLKNKDSASVNIDFNEVYNSLNPIMSNNYLSISLSFWK